MGNHFARVKFLLAISLTLAIMDAIWCGFAFVTTPVQQFETSAELHQSQASGMPITDDEIQGHLNRVASQRRGYGPAFVLAGASGLTTLAATVLLALNEPKKPTE